MTLAPTLRTARPSADADARPVAFLVSTTAGAGRIRDHMGSPAYSYAFVVDALAPVLERIGPVRRVDHPESRLAFAARRAEGEGFRPVHLAINPLQDVYLSPSLPNVVFPFWEFPDVPARDFGLDTRQNWERVCRPSALVVTACRFTAAAFEAAGVRAPLAVVPVPVEPAAFELPEWDESHTWTLTCRHETLGAKPAAVASESPAPAGPVAPPGRLAGALRAGFRRIDPWLSPALVGRVVRLKRRLVAGASARQSPWKFVYVTARDGYRNHVRRWLSAEALGKVSAARRRALALVGREPHVAPDPPLPSSPLTLGGGLVYLTVFNLGDRRKNYQDILTAFLHAFRDRPDATLVVKLVTNRVREHHEAGVLRAAYESLGLAHRCRVVVVTEFLSDEQMSELFRVSAFYVNASHAEGACLPLMRALAGGRPSIAPDHTAMADYMDEAVGFVPGSSPEPTFWPHDPEQRLETFRYRISWSDLRDAFLRSAEVAADRPRYDALARAARARMASYASREAAESALRAALELLPDRPAGGFDWD